MQLLSILLATATAAMALEYQGQHYRTSITEPSSTSPWFLDGDNEIATITASTLICCPPPPPVRWVLRNNDTTLLPSELFLSDSALNFDAPTLIDLSGVNPGGGFVLSAVLGEDTTQSFGSSEPFEIKDGSGSGEGSPKPNPACPKYNQAP